MNERAIARPQEKVGSTNTAARSHLVQRRCACGGMPGLDGECAECRRKRLALGRRSTNHVELTTVPPAVHDTPDSPGRPFNPDTRAFMEPRFGHNFGRVRVHTGAQAAGSPRAPTSMAERDRIYGAAQLATGAEPGIEMIQQAAQPVTVPLNQVAGVAGQGPSRPGGRPPPACSFNVQYANERTVNFCRPTSCGGAIQFDIVGVTASGPGCPSTLEGLDITEDVTSDAGCVPLPNKPVTGQFKLGPGGKPPPDATDTYGFCFPKDYMLQPICIQKLTQKVFVGGMLADTRTITFYIERISDFSAPMGMRCEAGITRS